MRLLALAAWVLLAIPAGALAAAPAGVILPYGGTSLPTGWLWADGAAVNRATYGELFTAIGTTYGAGDGSTTFNVPDMRQRFALGKAASGTGSTLGASGGTIGHGHAASLASHSHSLSLPNHTHSLGAFAAHAHSWTVGGASPLLDRFTPGYLGGAETGDTVLSSSAAGATLWTSTDGGTAAGSTASGTQTAGTTSAAQTASMASSDPPYLAVNYIVKTTATAVLPCGAIWPTARASAPSGGFLANGGAVSRTTYSQLFGCTGTAFGAGDGSTTFNLPNLTQRLALGKAASGTGSVLGASGGQIDHAPAATIGASSHSLTLAGHTHGATEPVYGHSTQYPTATTEVGTSFSMHSAWSRFTPSPDAAGGATVGSTFGGGGTVTTSSDGGQTVAATSANPPFQVLNHTLQGTGGAFDDVGVVAAYGGATLPSGWLWADGSTVSRTTYSRLHAAIGTSYGAGDGSTTFRLPDLQQRIPLGKASSGTGSTLGASGGAIDHAHSMNVAGHAHAATLGNSTHSWSFPGHAHSIPVGAVSTCADDGTGACSFEFTTGISYTGAPTTTTSGGQTVSSSGGGEGGTWSTSTDGAQSVTSGGANPPFRVVNYIVKAFPDPPVVTSTSPSSGKQGRRSLPVQVLGSGFHTGATVAFSGTDVTVTSTTFVSETRLDVVVDISSASSPGTRNVTVTNPEGTAGTATGIFTVNAPAISIGLSTLGYSDTARVTTAPYTISFGTLLMSQVRDIGPSGSGQTLAGPAVQATVTSDTDSRLEVMSSTWSNGTTTMPTTQLAYRSNGTSGAWTPFSTSATTIAGPTIPGTATWSYDLRLSIPAAQPAGSYSANLTFTAIAAA